MPDIVCNTSPLQYLHQAEVLWILPSLYGSIRIPQAVAGEIQAGREAGVPLPDLEALGWILVQSVNETPWPIPRDIHRGEAEAIALAARLGNSMVILDDLPARRHAKLLGLKVTGTLGVLLKAKTIGLIPLVTPVVDRLQKLGFRLAGQTLQEYLALAGESRP